MPPRVVRQRAEAVRGKSNAVVLSSMANDVAEMQAGIANLLVQIQNGNTQGAEDEANKIAEALAPLASSLRTAASQFDTSPPPPPPVDPNAPTGPRATMAARNQAIADAAKNHPAPKK